MTDTNHALEFRQNEQRREQATALTAMSAKVVREAIHSLSLDPKASADERHAFGLVSYHASDETLAKLGRLLKL